jgi:hypothetical protein
MLNFVLGVYNVVSVIGAIALFIAVVILGPMALFRRTREAAGAGMVIASWALGAGLWLWSALVVFSFWGVVGLIVGLLIAGVGVVPLAAIASLLNGAWAILIQLVVYTAVVLGLRLFGTWIGEKATAGVHPG